MSGTAARPSSSAASSRSSATRPPGSPGLGRMPWWRFLFWNAAGGIGWATVRRARRLLRGPRGGGRDPALRPLRRRRDRGAVVDRPRSSCTTAGSGSRSGSRRASRSLSRSLARCRLRRLAAGATTAARGAAPVRVPGLHARRRRRLREPRGDLDRREPGRADVQRARPSLRDADRLRRASPIRACRTTSRSCPARRTGSRAIAPTASSTPAASPTRSRAPE